MEEIGKDGQMENIQLIEQKLLEQYYEVNNQLLICKKSECMDLIKKKKHQYDKQFGMISFFYIAIAVGCIICFL